MYEGAESVEGRADEPRARVGYMRLYPPQPTGHVFGTREAELQFAPPSSQQAECTCARNWSRWSALLIRKAERTSFM